MRHASRFALFLAVLIMAAPGLLWGQANATGTITGLIVDQSGGVIPGAEVTITDVSTGTYRTQPTNPSGLFFFTNVTVGFYNVTVSAKGFRKMSVPRQEVTVGQQVTLNLTMEVGLTTQTVEVTAAPGAELQTMNSTMGQSLSGDAILNMPAMSRDVTGLLNYVPTAQPSFNGSTTNYQAGGIGGQMSDQNSYILDGGLNTDDLAGNNGYPTGYSSVITGAMPTPIESIEEFKVNTNNTTSDFSTSAGAQILMTTKRGTNTFHGSAYDYLQNSALNSNDFFNNLEGVTKPVSHSNRFGGSVGGPMLPNLAGGKTYFYLNYEGNRFPRSGPITRVVPSALMKQGILQFRDAAGNIDQYNLNTSTQCGPTGGEACDPRGIGLNPVVSALWNQYEPPPDCNLPASSSEDNLNTCGYLANLSYPLSDNFMVGRIDHDFGSKWRFMTSYRWYRDINPTTNEVDIGGLLPGDKLGVPASASINVFQPRYFVAGLTTTITPTLTNEFHFNYVRNFFQWDRAGALPQCFNGPGACNGIDAAVEVGGESTSALIPMNADTQNVRPRLWDGHDWDYRDSLSWLRGTHFFQFGGEFLHEWLHFDRYDNVVGGLTQPGYEVSDTGINFSPSQQPIPCAGASSTNCLPAPQIGTWNALYSDVTGMVDTTSVVVTRGGSNLTANPIGTPLHSYDIVQEYSLYFSDTWKVRPNLTLTYGLNWNLQMPPYDTHAQMSIMTDAEGGPIDTRGFINSVATAAGNGQTYNPTLAWQPIGATNGGEKYPYTPFWGGLGPRVSIAWSPGGDNRIFGHKSTVIRGGYARVYDRDLAINFISQTVLGVGFLQSVACADPTSAGACPATSDPTSAFRIGVDGKNPPLLGLVSPTLPVPTEPGVNVPYSQVGEGMDPKYKPGVSDQIDFSIQRQLPHDTIVEVGYVGVYSRNLNQGVDLDDAPYMMKSGGQTFAQAYDNVYNAVAAGATPAAQPFFESSLNASGYCGGFANCTAAVAANEGGNIGINNVWNIWNDLNSDWSFGKSLYHANRECLYCYTSVSNGYGNYNALVMSVQKRTTHGLTVNANATYAKALGISGLPQTYTDASPTNIWNYHTDYAPQYFDRKFTLNVLGTYPLPFGPGHKWGNSNGVVKRLVGGWAVSPIYTYATGLPMGVFSDEYYAGDSAFGENPNSSNGDSAIPMVNTKTLNNKAVQRITSDGYVGVNGDGFTNINIFGSNATQVYNSFRQPLVGIDNSSNPTGQLRGQPRWNVDLGITKDTRITERVGTQLYVQMFNVFNKTQFSDPFNSLADPYDFGAIEGQFNVLNNNFTRIIQIGLRVSF